MLVIGPNQTINSKIKKTDIVVYSDKDDTVNLTVDKGGLELDTLSFEIEEGEKKAIEATVSNTAQSYTITATSTDTSLSEKVSAFINCDDNAENSTVTDETETYSFDLSYGGNTEDYYTTTGLNGHGFRFTATDHNRINVTDIDTPAGTFFQIGKPFTVAMWVNLDDLPTFWCLFGGSIATNHPGVYVAQRYGRIDVFFRDVTLSQYLNLWGDYYDLRENEDKFLYYSYLGGDLYDLSQHICYVDNRDQALFVHAESGTVTDITRLDGVDVRVMGNGNSYSYNVDGVVSDVYISNQAGSEEEALKLYNFGRGKTYDNFTDSDSCSVTVSNQSTGTKTLKEVEQEIITAIKEIEPTINTRNYFTYQEDLLEEIENSTAKKRAFNLPLQSEGYGEFIGSTVANFVLQVIYPDGVIIEDIDEIKDQIKNYQWSNGIIQVITEGSTVEYDELENIAVLVLSLAVTFE